MRATTVFSIAILVAAITVPMLPAMANDTTAELATGGLVFTKNPNVVMREEDLFISMTEVRVRYVFFNNSAKDITNTVAFPMPDIAVDEQNAHSPVAIPTDDPQNILGFSTLIAGRSVPVQVEQKAFAKGVDQTALLHRLGIPLAPYFDSTQAALDKLPRMEWTHLINLGLAYTEGQSLWPSWTLKTNYYWQQTFRAQRELLIDTGTSRALGIACKPC